MKSVTIKLQDDTNTMLERWVDGKCIGIAYLPRHFSQNDINSAINRIELGPRRVVPRWLTQY